MTPQDRPETSAGGQAFRSGRAIALFLAATISGLAADLLSKDYVFQSLLANPNLPAFVQKLIDNRGAPSGDQILHSPEIRPYIQRQVAPGIKFTLQTNPGVVFGFRLPRPVVAAVTICAIGLVAFLMATSDRRAWSIHLALAFIMAGALGNLHDRLFSVVKLPGVYPDDIADAYPVIQYQVRDFIDCSQLYYPWVFNIADVFLVAGVAILLLHWALAKGSKADTSRTDGVRRN